LFDGIALATALCTGALVAWIVSVASMRGMDHGPGGGLGWYLGIWVPMMAVMMLSSVAPTVLVFAHVTRGRVKRGSEYVSRLIFVGAYFAVWTTYGLIRYGLSRLPDAGFLTWHRAGRRRQLRRLLLGPDGDPVRARRDEPALDGGRSVPDLCPKDAAAGRSAYRPVRRRLRRGRDLDRRRPGTACPA
jgi:hypothetical protein